MRVLPPVDLFGNKKWQGLPKPNRPGKPITKTNGRRSIHVFYLIPSHLLTISPITLRQKFYLSMCKASRHTIDSLRSRRTQTVAVATRRFDTKGTMIHRNFRCHVR